MNRNDAVNPRPVFPKKPQPKKRKSFVISNEMREKLQELELQNRNRNIQNANATENALCGQLMLISTVFLTITVAILASQEGLAAVSDLVKKFIMSGLLLLMASIAAGVIYYFRNISFYQKWGEAHNENYKLLLSEELNDETLDKLESHSVGLKSRSSDRWLKVQLGLMGLSAIAYAIVILGVLFDFGIR